MLEEGGEIVTKETERAFVILYAEYLRRRKYGIAKPDAAYFEESKANAIEGFADWNSQDIAYCFQELSKAGYVKMNIVGDVTLQERGIEYMESKPKDYFSAFAGIVKDLLALVASVLPVCIP